MLIRLTQLPHPDIPGKDPSCYIDASRILTIEAGWVEYQKEGSLEAYRQALWSLHGEVLRAGAEVDAMQRTVVPDTEAQAKEMDAWMQRKDICNALQTAYGLVAHYQKPTNHPRQPCTVIGLACGTGLEHGVMLKQVFVSETPGEVADTIASMWSDEKAALRGLPT